MLSYSQEVDASDSEDLQVRRDHVSLLDGLAEGGFYLFPSRVLVGRNNCRTTSIPYC